jgi:hypothetical protein
LAWKGLLPLPDMTITNWFSDRGRDCDLNDAMVFHWPSVAQGMGDGELGRRARDAYPAEVKRTIQTLDFVRL